MSQSKATPTQYRWSLSRLLQTYFIGIVLLATVILVSFALYAYDSELKNLQRRHLAKQTQSIHNWLITQKGRGLEDTASVIAAHNALRQFLSMQVDSQLEVITSVLMREYADKFDYGAFFVHNRKKPYFFQFGMDAIQQVQVAATVKNHPLVIKTLETQDKHSSLEILPTIDGTPLLMLSAAVPLIRNKNRLTTNKHNNYQFIGVLLLRRVINDNQRLMQELSDLWDVRAAFLLNERVITSTFTPPEINELVYQSLQCNGDAVTAYAQQTFFAVAPLCQNNILLGKLFVQTSITDYHSAISRTLLETLIYISLGVLLLFVLSYWISRLIIKPLNGLSKGVERITQGDLQYRLPTAPYREFDQLSHAFNVMAKRLHDVINGLEEREQDALRQLQHTLSHMNAILNNMGEGVLVTDSHGYITHINPVFQKMFPRHTEVVGQLCAEVYSADITQLVEYALKQIQMPSGGKTIQLDNKRLGSGIATPILATPNEQPNAQTQMISGCVVLVRDINEQHKAIETAKQARQLAEQANQAKDTFLANMSHELRNPLGVIIGFADVLRERLYGELNPEQQKKVEEIYDSSQRLLSIINDVIDLARIETDSLATEKKDVVLMELCEASFLMVKLAAAKRNVQLKLEMQAYYSHIYSDERRLKQILVNLLTQAVKLCEPNSTLRLCIQSNQDKTMLYFCIVDNGIGIFRDRVAQYVQNHSQSASLTLVKRLVSLLNGELQIETASAQGNGFIVCFPWARRRNVTTSPSNVPPEPTPLPLQEATPDNAQVEEIEDKVLIVSPHPNYYRVIEKHLREADYQVEIANNAVNAWEAVCNYPDVLMLDAQLPNNAALELIKRVRADEDINDIPIIVFSESNEADTQPVYQTAGADACYNSKVADYQNLLSLVNQLRGSGHVEA